MKWIINTITSWSEAPRARHQVTNELIKINHTIFFVERNSTGFRKIKTRKEKENLIIVTPYFPLNYKFRYRLPFINEIYQNWLYKKLRKDFGEISVINFDFNAHLLQKYFKRTIYYCNDEYIGNSKYPNFFTNVYHKYCERKVIKNSVFCISTAHYITEKLLKINPNIHEIPLGGPDLSSSLELIENSSNQKEIHVSLVGFISTRNISYTVINKIMEDTSIRLSLIGPVEDGFLKKINKLSRIKLMGVLIGDEFYNAIHNSDVAIAPYNLERINPGTTPNKLYQYLACGKPVVISNLPNLKFMKFPEKSVYIANDEDDFIKLIHQAYKETSKELETERKRFSYNNTWNSRIKKFLVIASENGFLN